MVYLERCKCLDSLRALPKAVHRGCEAADSLYFCSLSSALIIIVMHNKYTAVLLHGNMPIHDEVQVTCDGELEVEVEYACYRNLPKISPPPFYM